MPDFAFGSCCKTDWLTLADTSTSDRDTRYPALDALRGVAALAVMLAHCAVMQRFDGFAVAALSDTPRLVGKQAVIIFFVLSGFVLFLSLEKNAYYLPFITKRIVRIYLPFSFAIFASAALHVLVWPTTAPILGGSSSWQIPPLPKLILGHLAMTDRVDLRSLDNVMWSLVHELRISMIFPVLAWTVTKDWRWALAGSLTISALALALLDTVPGTALVNPFATLRYLVLFAAGAVLAVNRASIAKWLNSGPALRRTIWVVVLLCMLGHSQALENLTTTIAAVLLVALCASCELKRARLIERFLQWLGRISYSLYLIHLPILLATFHLLAGVGPGALIISIGIVGSLLAAEAMQRLVESPAIRLGAKLARACRGGRAEVRQPA